AYDHLAVLVFTVTRGHQAQHTRVGLGEVTSHVTRKGIHRQIDGTGVAHRDRAATAMQAATQHATSLVVDGAATLGVFSINRLGQPAIRAGYNTLDRAVVIKLAA